MKTADVLRAIRAGDRVTIANRFGQRRAGRAVMRGPHGWVLNKRARYLWVFDRVEECGRTLRA